jgi:hypothetical protein
MSTEHNKALVHRLFDEFYFRRSHLTHIQQLDPRRDHQEICALISWHEFPFDNTRSLEFALFRTFASPGIAALLHRTGEFGGRAQKRYDDTDLIISEIFEHGYDSERGLAAIRRMNQLHGRFPISNEDYLYVLSTFVFEPPRWMARFGWRPMVENEKLSLFYCWREIGRRMGIQNIPADYAEFECYNIEYERAHFRFAEANRHVANATRNLFLGWLLPRPLWKFGEPFIYALLDEGLLEAFGYPKPSPAMRRFVERLLKLRGRLVRLLPERRQPLWRTGPRRPTYPTGYRIEELGPKIEKNKPGEVDYEKRNLPSAP